MSRTFKDRPFEVRSNDPRERRLAYHNHDRFGIIRTIPTDENGNEIGYCSAAYRRAVNTNSFADHCTLDEPWVKSPQNAFQKPCGYYIYSHSNRPRKTDRTDYHGGHRKNETNWLVHVIAVANAQYDVDEMLEHEAVNSRNHRHNGWW